MTILADAMVLAGSAAIIIGALVGSYLAAAHIIHRAHVRARVARRLSQ